MELPHLGIHCHVAGCNQLDFLPVKCGGCNGVFCKNHYPHALHSCPASYTLQKQVPVCPLCGAVVPVGAGELPDVRVGRHIDTACQSRPALELKGKIFSNSCCAQRCKKKELVPFQCPRCFRNFCVSHRNELDHNCPGVRQSNDNFRHLNPSGAAAIFRAVFSHNPLKSTTQPPSTSANPPVLNDRPQTAKEEQEQLELALKASLQDPTQPRGNRQGGSSSADKSCVLS